MFFRAIVQGCGVAENARCALSPWVPAKDFPSPLKAISLLASAQPSIVAVGGRGIGVSVSPCDDLSASARFNFTPKENRRYKNICEYVPNKPSLLFLSLELFLSRCLSV